MTPLDTGGAADLWAKSPQRPGTAGEPLMGHVRLVVARLHDLYGRLPDLADHVAAPRLWHRLFWACIFHDLGKIASGFQRQVRVPGFRWQQRHEVLSLAFLDWILPADADLYGDRTWIAAAVASHHRDMSKIWRAYEPPLDEDDPDAAAPLVNDVTPDAATIIAEWLHTGPGLLAHAHPFSGLEMYACRIEPTRAFEDLRRSGTRRIHAALLEYRRFFKQLEHEAASHPLNRAALVLRGLMMLADHTASAHVRIGTTAPLGPAADLQQRFGLASLHDHQADLRDTRGNALLVAPTGSGKTEGALLWGARQTEEIPGGPRFFYVLPYQTSINAMYGRLWRHFPRRVALQHGRAVQALYRFALDRTGSPDAAEREARHERQLGRLHHHPVRVLTPYQLLRGFFRLRGYESIVADAARSLFVFDEMHAYEPRRLGMLLAALEYWTWDLGGRALVMSATLPQVLAAALRSVLPDLREVNASEETFAEFQRHRLSIIPGEIYEATDEIVRCAAAGQSVLVVCNTVGGARRLARELRERLSASGCDVAIDLLHGRFNAHDRLHKERQLLRRRGTNAVGGVAGKPVVLVATQVVEVSLDIDFDVLFTEPAPLEALLQRFGRVNRGRRGGLRDVFVLTEPDDGQGIYDPAYIAAALAILSRHDGEPVNEAAVSDWLSEVYRGAVADAWRAQVRDGRQSFRTACIETLRAFESEPELEARFDQLFDGTEVLPEGLRSIYLRAMDHSSSAASAYLVPVSYRQFERLRRQGVGRWDDELRLNVVDVPYTEEDGLQLDAPGVGAGTTQQALEHVYVV